MKPSLQTWRRLSQISFFILFIFFFLAARYPFTHGLPVDLYIKSSPLVAIGTLLASRTFLLTLFPALIILLLTISLGRIFCGWICPLGTMIDFSDKIFKRFRLAARPQFLHKIRFVKNFLLIFILAAALFSLQLYWIFDPIVIFTRAMALAIYPAFVLLSQKSFDLLFQLNVLQDTIYWFYDVLLATLLPIDNPEFYSAIPAFLIFLFILLPGFIARRFWCQSLCPLGAMLGFFSRFSLLGRRVTSDCTHCNNCLNCRMNAIPETLTETITSECIVCGECAHVCGPGVISFGVNRGRAKNSKVDLKKRQFVVGGLSGLAGACLFHTLLADPVKAGTSLRPPGALPEFDFLDRCARCQECVRICSTTGACLQPLGLQSGLEAVWSPVVRPSTGYCEYNCNLCGQVCPTGAIQTLSLPDKQSFKMGIAIFNKDTCIPWADHQDCLVCEEHCPIPEKAIKFNIEQVIKDGLIQFVKFPHVVNELCNGCGICEYKCPVNGDKGVKINRI